MPQKQPRRKILYVKLASLDDLSRMVCNFNYTSSQVLSLKFESAYRIFAIGAELCSGTAIAYYLNSARQEHSIGYTYPSSPGQAEGSYFMPHGSENAGVKIGIINISDTQAMAANPRSVKPLLTARLETCHDLVSAALMHYAGSETIPCLYSFQSGKRRILFALNILEISSDDQDMLCYSYQETPEPHKFARYKYSENKVDFTDHIGEHSYMYAKIINLAEPFPLFKMPD